MHTVVPGTKPICCDVRYHVCFGDKQTCAKRGCDAVRSANCGDCGSKWDNQRAAPAGSFAPNGFGLYDVAGNVWEWTEDCVHKNYNGAPADGSPWLAASGGDCTERILRGGSWDLTSDNLRSATRGRDTVVSRGSVIGFRVARTLSAR